MLILAENGASKSNNSFVLKNIFVYETHFMQIVKMPLIFPLSLQLQNISA